MPLPGSNDVALRMLESMAGRPGPLFAREDDVTILQEVGFRHLVDYILY